MARLGPLRLRPIVAGREDSGVVRLVGWSDVKCEERPTDVPVLGNEVERVSGLVMDDDNISNEGGDRLGKFSNLGRCRWGPGELAAEVLEKADGPAVLAAAHPLDSDTVVAIAPHKKKLTWNHRIR